MSGETMALYVVQFRFKTISCLCHQADLVFLVGPSLEVILCTMQGKFTIIMRLESRAIGDYKLSIEKKDTMGNLCF